MISYINQESGYRRQLLNKWLYPFLFINIVMLIVLLIAYYFIIKSAGANILPNGDIEFVNSTSKTSEPTRINYQLFKNAVIIGFLLVFSIGVFSSTRFNNSYYKDYRFGQIVVEVTTIQDISHTPAGIDIYYLSSDNIFTINSSEIANCRLGDSIKLYYLKHSKDVIEVEKA